MRWLTEKKTMMVGIDVTHPGPGSRDGTPSIAAVVASVDDSFVQFPASLRIQASKKEVGELFFISHPTNSNAGCSDVRRIDRHAGGTITSV
jgi:hypothetical protein